MICLVVHNAGWACQRFTLLEFKTKIPSVQKVERIRSFCYFKELTFLIKWILWFWDSEAENNYTLTYLPNFLFCYTNHLWSFTIKLNMSHFQVPVATLVLMHMDFFRVAHIAWKSLGRQLQTGWSILCWCESNAVSAK